MRGSVFFPHSTWRHAYYCNANYAYPRYDSTAHLIIQVITTLEGKGHTAPHKCILPHNHSKITECRFNKAVKYSVFKFFYKLYFLLA